MKLYKKEFIFISLIFSLTFAAYFNSFNNEFLWDDEFLIQKNTFITDSAHIPQILTSSSTAGFGNQDNFYRPTQTLYYLLIHSIAGKEARAYHIGNTLLHALNGVLLFLLLIKLFKNSLLAFATSLLWALHPVHTEAITYISGTADPMSFFFVLLMLITFPSGKMNWISWRYIGSLFLFSLALLSKESVIIAPGLLFLIIFLKNKSLTQWKIYTPLIPFAFISLGYLALRNSVLNFDETYQFYKNTNIYTENILYRTYTFLAALTEYITILVWPQDLHMERRFPVYTSPLSLQVIVGISIVTLCALASYILRKSKLAPFSFLWFFIAFIPMMGIIIPVNSFLLEHWLYIPSVAFILAITHLVFYFSKKQHPMVFPTIIFFIAISLTAATHHRNKDWKTPVSFYTNILAYNGGTARIHNNLAMAYSERGELDKAISHYLTAIAMSDTYHQTHYNLARVFVRKNQLDKAIIHLNRSLKISPQFTHAQKLLNEINNFLKKNTTK